MFPLGISLRGGGSLLGHGMTLSGGGRQLSCVTGLQQLEFANNIASADNAPAAVCDLESVPQSRVFGRVYFSGGTVSAKVCNVSGDDLRVPKIFLSVPETRLNVSRR